MQIIEITTESIQLDQLLKWAGVIDSGGQVRFMLDDQLILVNDCLATEKRKRIFPNDIVEIKGSGIFKVSKK